MDASISRVFTILFFAAVLIISIVIIATKKDTEDIETEKTIEAETYVSETEVTDASEERFYGHDIEIETAPSETQSTDILSSDTLISETIAPESSVTDAVTTSRTIITSRQRKEYDKNAVYHDMENILQNPELPVGCEITALTILLRHYGFDAEKTDLAKKYLPISWGNPQTIDGKLHKDSFFDYFIGDPFSRGYGCFSPAIEKAANKYIADNGGGYTVKNISGCHPDTLYEYLIAGTPVLCWATDGMIEPEYYETWYDNATGKQLDWYLNEHCFVLAGFNIKNSTVTLNDPMKGIIDYNIDKFEVRFKQMHSQAIVLIPDGTEDIVTTAETTAAVTEPMTTETVSASEETITGITSEALPEDTTASSETQPPAESTDTSPTETTTSASEEYVDYAGGYVYEIS